MVVVFVDANVLAKPVTRTILIAAGERSGFRAVWSQTALRQADAHLRPGMTAVSDLSTRFGWETTPVGPDPARFPRTASSDRQILADAVAAGAWYLITEDVDDFDVDELVGVGLAAVGADLFMPHRVTDLGYLEALDTLAAGRRRPPDTPEQLHAALGRQHPLLARAKVGLFPDVAVVPPTQGEAAVVYRGGRCLRCDGVLDEVALLERGLGPECRTGVGSRHGVGRGVTRSGGSGVRRG
ncbi:MAG: hypothetical protein LBL55_03305 [Propionibacteriaceae bacterium]|jgi:hypothetical protein|nr:hypothetical protein [Propionibacteriaceae bacterium]